jgi:hypothetical protein
VNLIDRFTRDDVSAKIWWPVAMTIVVLFILTFPAAGRDADAAHHDATAQAVTITQGTIAPTIPEQGAITPAVADQLRATLQDDVFDEVAGVNAIRLWAADAEGTMLFSTDADDHVGSAEAVNDPQIKRASQDPSSPVDLQSEVSVTGESSGARFEVYQALASRPEVVAQVDYDDATLLADATSTWWAWRIALGVAGVLTLALAALSIREPLARIGAGVTFYPASVPAGSAVIDADDAEALRQAGAHARRRVQEMQSRMEQLEYEKVELQGELQRALSTRSMAPSTPAAIPRPSSQTERPPEDEPASAASPTLSLVPPPEREPVVELPPEREPVVELPPAMPASPDEPPAFEPDESAEPAASFVAQPREAEPVIAPPPPAAAAAVAASRGASKPKAPSRKRRAAPEPAHPSRPQPQREAPMSDETLGFGSDPTPAPSPRSPEPVPDAWAAGDVVRVPDAAGPDQDEDVLAVLERLVEPVSAGARSPDEASDLRARLARTAARKKPGARSDERFEHPTQQ